MRMQAKLNPKGWQPETMQALRFLYATEDELRAAKSLNPVRWMTQLVQQQQLPTFGYFFDQPQSNLTETRVDQVCPCLQNAPKVLQEFASCSGWLSPNGHSSKPKGYYCYCSRVWSLPETVTSVTTPFTLCMCGMLHKLTCLSHPVRLV